MKIITIFGTVTSFFMVPVCSMEKMVPANSTGEVIPERSTFIIQEGDYHEKQLTRLYAKNLLPNPSSATNKDPVNWESDQMRQSLLLTILEFFRHLPWEKKDEKNLRRISHAVYKGVPLSSKCLIQYSTKGEKEFLHFRCDLDSESVFKSIENLSELPCIRSNPKNDNKKKLLMQTLFDGHHYRQKHFDSMKNKLEIAARDICEVELSEDLINLIFSLLPEYQIYQENEKLIKEAELKFDEGQPSQPNLGQTSLQKILNFVRNKLW